MDKKEIFSLLKGAAEKMSKMDPAKAVQDPDIIDEMLIYYDIHKSDWLTLSQKMREKLYMAQLKHLQKTVNVVAAIFEGTDRL